MTKKLHVQCSPITGEIFTGSISKCGTLWLSDKTDVTMEAIKAVADLADRKGGVLKVLNLDDTLAYEITVKHFKDKTDD